MSEYKDLERKWEVSLKRHFLNFRDEDNLYSPWILSRQYKTGDPTQGWKLHVSATILTATSILDCVAPILRDNNVLYKVPKTLATLKKINCGLFYGFSQVGKFLTVYPSDAEQAVKLAKILHNVTRRLSGPVVPYDLKYADGSLVHYRYGAFDSKLEIQSKDGNIPAISNPSGILVPDDRGPKYKSPDWIEDPFQKESGIYITGASKSTPLGDRVKAYKSLSQRGKGGVYRSLHLGFQPAIHWVLKEGRRHGETEWDGRDGRWRVIHEAKVLRALDSCNVRGIPRVVEDFSVEMNHYLVMELIEGSNLQSLLLNKSRRIPFERRMQYGFQIAELIKSIHDAGWAWRDCKPLNIIIRPAGGLAAIDFEGASNIQKPDMYPWGTEMYVPPEWPLKCDHSIGQDAYALGVTLYQLFNHHIESDPLSRPQTENINRKLPKKIKTLIAALVEENPRTRSSVTEAVNILAEQY